MKGRAARPRRRSLAFVCPACERPIYAPFEASARSIDCADCGRTNPLREGAHALANDRLERCIRCGLDRLYRQKDFNRKIGLWVFVAAAILSVPTWGVSLLVATLIDRALYYALGDVAICYGCNTQHRGFGRNPAHGDFDLHVAEAIERQPRAV